IMTAIEFITKLRDAAPVIENLEGFMEREVAQAFIGGYNAKRKDNEFKENKTLLFELVENYQVQKIEVGILSFLKNLRIVGDRIEFGMCGEHTIAVDGITGEIVLLEIDDYLKVNYCCARDFEHFLGVFLHYAWYNNRELAGYSFNRDGMELIVREGVELAGGKSYELFLKFIFQS
ncbi:MAG: hypothetical protein H7Y04_12210, partial [Verrucomicrobia bacterium]|nr:hypothetical protein [Cytophagales bacterium]